MLEAISGEEDEARKSGRRAADSNGNSGRKADDDDDGLRKMTIETTTERGRRRGNDDDDDITGCAKLSAQGSFIFKNPVEKMIFVCIKDRYEKISLLAFKTKIHRE